MPSKPRKATWVAILFAVSLIASCGGGGGSSKDTNPNGDNGDGGGGADQVSFLISGGTTTVRTETFDLNVPTIFFNPYIYGHYVQPSDASGSDKTFLDSYSNYVDGVGFTETVEITFAGNSTGSFSIGGKNGISLVTSTYSYIASSGTITVNTYGAVDSHMSGIFNVSDGSKTMTGTFYVTRDADM